MGQAEMLAGKELFFWKSGNPEAVLCLHGFTGAPGVFRKLGRVFQSEGLSVFAPVLPGHGTVPEDLIEVTDQRLLDAAEQAYDSLACAYERVHVVGLSMGGTLATLLAANHARESGLGCISLLPPGYGFHQVLAQRLGLDHWTDSSEKYGRMIPIPRRKPQGGELDECFFGYEAAPLNLFGQLLLLNRAAWEAQPEIEAPVQLLYTEADAIVDAGACAKAAGRFPHLEEVRAFSQSEHNLLLGGDREETMLRCTAFIRRHRLPKTGGGENSN